MASIEDLMSPAERICSLQENMSEAADDLLVENKFAPPRGSQIYAPSYGVGMVVVIKDKPRIDFKLELYPNETEEPHFKVTYQNATCRFKISDCTPMKAEIKNGIPTPIKKIMKVIRQVWTNNREDIVRAWMETRPSNQNHGHQHIR